MTEEKFDKPKYKPVPPSQKTHGMSYTRAYHSWQQLKNRCLNKNDRQYPDYGGRGISVCEEWLVFENFYKDMGNPPNKDYSIDRINNDGNYEPTNCRWATRYQQNMNRRSTRFITFRGITKTLVDWAREMGINEMTLRGRVNAGVPINLLFVRKYDSRLYR